jgi:hypothetical protein
MVIFYAEKRIVLLTSYNILDRIYENGLWTFLVLKSCFFLMQKQIFGQAFDQI